MTGVREIPIEQYHRKHGRGGTRKSGGKGEWIVTYLMVGSAIADESVCPAVPHSTHHTRLRSRTFPTRALAVEFGKSGCGGYASPFFSSKQEMGQSPPKGDSTNRPSSYAGADGTGDGQNMPAQVACEPRTGVVPRSLYLRRGGECGLVATFGGSRMCHFKWKNEDRSRGVVAIRDSVKGSISD